jgi:phosphoribosyl 1,2-cyclic phosphodiesterase
MWFSYGDVRGVIDPGPGSLVRITSAVPELDPGEIRSILLTHRHLDHSSDVNILAEAMTGGAFEQRGSLALPPDAIAPEALLLGYLARKVGRIIPLAEETRFRLGEDVEVEPVRLIHHGVDVFGFILRSGGLPTWGVIPDTRPLPLLAERFGECSFLSLNVTLEHPRPRLDHFSVPDVAKLLETLTPRLLVLTHMGRGLLARGPEIIASDLCTASTRVVAATDGTVVDLESLGILHAPMTPPDPRSHAARFALKEGPLLGEKTPRGLPSPLGPGEEERSAAPLLSGRGDTSEAGRPTVRPKATAEAGAPWPEH